MEYFNFHLFLSIFITKYLPLRQFTKLLSTQTDFATNYTQKPPCLI